MRKGDDLELPVEHPYAGWCVVPDFAAGTLMLFELEKSFVVHKFFGSAQSIERNAQLAAGRGQQPGANFIDQTGPADAITAHEGSTAHRQGQSDCRVECVNDL